jgi:hypothetical protein
MRKQTYLVIDHEVVIDGDNQPKCFKFYPCDASLLKFSFQEYEDGYIVSKVSHDIGFTMLSHKMTFPTKGIFYIFFELRAIRNNDFVIGIRSTSSPSRSLYFNFFNGQIEANGRQIRGFECELMRDSVIGFAIDAKKQHMIC